MAKVEVPGRVGRDEFDINLLAVFRTAAIGVWIVEDRAYDSLQSPFLHEEINESGTRDLDVINKIGLQVLLEIAGQLAGIAMGQLGAFHGSVGRIVAMAALLAPLNDDVGVGKIQSALGKGLAEAFL